MYMVALQSPEASGTDANDTIYIHNPYNSTFTIEEASIVPNMAVTAHADNHITTTLKDGIGGSTIASQTTDSDTGAAHVAGTPIPLTLSGTGTTLEIPANGVIEITVVKAGTGPAYSFVVTVLGHFIR